MDYSKRLKKAVAHFWKTRKGQSTQQELIGRTDQGARSAVTGGKQLDGMVLLMRELALDAGVSETSIYTRVGVELPGYFRPEKKWDLLIVHEGLLLAVIEFKSQVGPSFGNNFNNRTEEAIGNAQDIWTAYREGAFPMTTRPWLGYFLLLEDSPKSVKPVGVKEPHFAVFPEFVDASYAQRYQHLMTRLVRERLYDSCCFLMSKQSGKSGNYTEPSEDIAFDQFAKSFEGHLSTSLARG